MKIFVKECSEYEAELLVQVENEEFLCYSDYGDINYQHIENIQFVTLLAQNVVRSSSQIFSIEKTDRGYFSHKIVGKFIGNNKVAIKDCIFVLDTEIPKDIKIGEYVSFDFLRSDITYLQ